MTIPADWLPDAHMERVIVHWTAGAHRASGLDRSHYHVLIEGDGGLVRGSHSIKANEYPILAGYAAHTLNCNTGSIGVSLCCMAGAVEYPFDPGGYPMTRVQWDALAPVLADLCRRYSIPVSDRTILSHAEVQGNLGIRQRGKWDIARLAFDPGIVGARAVGDRMRAAVRAALAGPTTTKPAPGGEVSGRVAVGWLNLRDAPGGRIIGQMPMGTRLVIHGSEGSWLNVTTPYPVTGWAHGGYIERD